MIIILLLLILLVLLCGRATVKGWLSAVAAAILGFLALAGALVALSSVLGEAAAIYTLAAIPVAVLLLSGILIGVNSYHGSRATHNAQAKDARVARKNALRGIPKIDRLRHHFAEEIARFEPAARKMLSALYAANDIEGLAVLPRPSRAYQLRPVSLEFTVRPVTVMN